MYRNKPKLKVIMLIVYAFYSFSSVARYRTLHSIYIRVNLVNCIYFVFNILLIKDHVSFHTNANLKFQNMNLLNCQLIILKYKWFLHVLLLHKNIHPEIKKYFLDLLFVRSNILTNYHTLSYKHLVLIFCIIQQPGYKSFHADAKIQCADYLYGITILFFSTNIIITDIKILIYWHCRFF